MLKTPVRRLSLKDNSTTKDIKTPYTHDLTTTPIPITFPGINDDTSINKRQPLLSNSNSSRKIKVKRRC